MTVRRFILLFAFCLVLPVWLDAAEPASSPIEQVYARGVYWPWERTRGYADAAGKEFWQFVDDMMKTIKEDWHCNVVWFVNGPSDPVRVCDLAEKHGLLVLCNTKLNGLFVHGTRGEAQVDEKVKETVDLLSGKNALGAYVLKDEPKVVEAAQMESFRAALAVADPARPSIVVTMTQHTEPYALDTGFPIICTDIYHFGGDRSPYIPNPSRRSMACFRGAVDALCDMTRKSRKIAWSMPQAFCSVWGASWVDKDGFIVIEPGSYWHWRMPSPAEMRWQIWESVRAGCKGVVFFSILLGGRNTWTPDAGEMPEKMRMSLEKQKGSGRPLAKERIRTGAPGCLTGAGGVDTPQSLAMAETFGKLEALEGLLMTLHEARMPAIFADAPGSVATYKSARETRSRFCIVVNDDVKEARDITLYVLPHTKTVTDLVNGADLTPTPPAIDAEGLRVTTLSLAPGAGTVLRMTYRDDQPGWFLFRETFGGRNLAVKLKNAARHLESRGFGMGRRWIVRPDDEAPVDADSAIVLENLQKHNHGRGSHLATAMRAVKEGTAAVYLKIDGRSPRAESIVVQFVDAEGKAGWNRTDAYHLPIRLPADLAELRVRLADDASVTRLRLWRVPLQKE